jgi:small-conductance mechanosensitive channel
VGAPPETFDVCKAMHQVTTFLRRWPRTSAALGFGAAGAALSMVWWSPVIFQARGVLPFVLFIGTPGVSAAIAGWALGKPLLNSARADRQRSAALRGMAIASLALLLFAPLFATLYVLTQPATEHWDIVSLTFLIFVGSAVVVWWLVALTGAAVGWALNCLASYDTGRESA